MPVKSNFEGKKLYRSQKSRMIGGVCGGIADYFNVDPNLVRLIWVVVALFGGVGIIAYIASLIIIPNNPDDEPSEKTTNLIKDKSLFWGSLLVIVGVFLLLKQTGLFYTFSFWNIPWQSVWAVFLILIGVFLLYNRMKESEKVNEGEIPEPKKLYRSRSMKMIGGVCGGLSVYFKFDVSIIRILWVLGTLVSAGVGIIVYIIMMIVFPEEADAPDNKSINV